MNAGIDKATLSRWLQKAEHAREGGSWHDFYLEVCRAKAAARLSLARAAYKAAIDDGNLAWKMAQRIEPAFRPTMIERPAFDPIHVELKWHEDDLNPAITPSSELEVLTYPLPPTPIGEEPA